MKKQLEEMKKMIESGKLGHAYLLLGENSEDLFDFALSFSALLLNEKNSKRVINSLEFHLLEAKDEDEIKIEKIRELTGYLSLSSANSGVKVALIKDADKMNKSAANALLKVLEEPKKNKVIVLTSSNSGILPPTILSRVQKIEILTKQQKNVINNSKLAEQLHKILNSDLAGKFEAAEKISKKENIDTILSFWLSFFHDLLYLKSDCQKLIKNSSYIEYLKKASEKYSTKDIKFILKEISKSKDILRNTNTNPRLVLENLMLDF